MENVALPYDRVDQIGVAVKLILNDIVEYLEQEEHEMMVGRCGEQEPRCTKGLQQMEKFHSSDHRQGFQIRRHIDEDREQTVEERLQSLMASSDDLVEHRD